MYGNRNGVEGRGRGRGGYRLISWMEEGVETVGMLCVGMFSCYCRRLRKCERSDGGRVATDYLYKWISKDPSWDSIVITALV